MLQSQTGQIDVRALQHVGRREHDISVFAGGTGIDINHHQELQFFKRRFHKLTVTYREQRITGDHHQPSNGVGVV